MATPPRVRRSIRKLSLLENRKELDNLIRAFRGIQQLPPTDPNSYFVIAGYHGLPWATGGEGVQWGGYCFHDAVLFPTWHRAYCLRIENALRSIKGCEDVTLPYWDELAEAGSQTPVPPILTEPKYVLDNQEIPNPLYSYALQRSLVDEQSKNRYSKHANYSSVRFPLSGLVGTPGDQQHTEIWNERFPNPSEQLNGNIRNWLIGEVDLNKDLPNVGLADTYSTIARMRRCLDAPNWTVFSNKRSAIHYTEIKRKEPNKHWVVALEEPHNAIHLALGGHFQPATGPNKDQAGYNANPRDFQYANGDMGCNETAAFDPIFFLHHAFIDYMMWAWQKKNRKTKRGSLEIDYSLKGTVMDQGGNAALPKGATMKMDSPLKPFQKPNSDQYYTSDDVTDITELGYTYEPGSLEISNRTPMSVDSSLEDIQPSWETDESNPLMALSKTATVNVGDYQGSFVIRTFAVVDGKEIEIARDPILSRYDVDSCGNCQNALQASSIVPIHKTLAEALDPENTRKIKYVVKVQELHEVEYKPITRHGFASDDGPYIEY